MNEELKVIISAEISKLKKGVDDATKSIKGFKAQMEKVEAGEDVTETADELLEKISDVLNIVDGGAEASKSAPKPKAEEVQTEEKKDELNIEAKKDDVAIKEEKDSKNGNNKFSKRN